MASVMFDWKRHLRIAALAVAITLTYFGLMWLVIHYGGCPKGQAFRIVGAWVGCL